MTVSYVYSVGFATVAMMASTIVGCGNGTPETNSQTHDVAAEVKTNPDQLGNYAYFTYRAESHSLSRGLCTSGKPVTKEFCQFDLVSVDANKAYAMTREVALKDFTNNLEKVEGTSPAALDKSIAEDLILLARHQDVVRTETQSAKSSGIVAAQVRESQAAIKELQQNLTSARTQRAQIVLTYGDFNSEFSNFWANLLKSSQRYDLTTQSKYVDAALKGKFATAQLIASALGNSIVQLIKDATMPFTDADSANAALEQSYLEFSLANAPDSNLSSQNTKAQDFASRPPRDVEGARVVIFQGGQILRRVEKINPGQLVCIGRNLLPGGKNSLSAWSFSQAKHLELDGENFHNGFAGRRFVGMDCGLLSSFKLPGQNPLGSSDAGYINEGNAKLVDYPRTITIGDLRQTLGSNVTALRVAHY